MKDISEWLDSEIAHASAKHAYEWSYGSLHEISFWDGTLDALEKVREQLERSGA